jgi:hypothetical protein
LKYIVRTLRFEDGEWDKGPLERSDATGYGMWKVVQVLDTHNALNGIYYLTCLIEDRA